QDVQLLLHLADSFHDEPFTISQLVRMSCSSIALQVFAEGIQQWREQDLRDFQQAFTRFNFCRDASRALKAERVWSSTIINYVESSPNKFHLLDNMFRADQQQGLALGTLLMSVSPDGWFALEKRNCCRMIDRYVLPEIDVERRRIDPQATHRAEQALSSLEAGAAPGLLFRHVFFARVLMPGGAGLPRRTAMAQTGVDSAVVACALELFRRQNGRLPERLDALEPGFISKLPQDIITGQALKYRPGADGRYILYSVGWNEIDDGGVMVAAKPGESEVGGDWVWRLP
ncbi:MAG TPA: hypothetical protein VHI52_01050, partial [Verrucomicrobiae bacterium]|nr:hypothetical protein [Verrucomicrobiae bacterium]